MKRLALISCSSQKLTHAAPARELYCSSLFRKSVAWCEARDLEWSVISGKHGLVTPDTLMVPYDNKVTTKKQQIRLAALVQSQLLGSRDFVDVEDLVVLAGKAYTDPLKLYLEDFFGMEFPLEGMQIGERLRFLGAASA